MFYLAEAHLFSKGLTFSSHSTVIAAFGKEFTKTNLIANSYHRSLRDGFETRQIGDDSFETTVSREKAVQILKGATEFFYSCERIPGCSGYSSLSNSSATAISNLNIALAKCSQGTTDYF